MIIHSPIISGSLTFADGSTFTLPDGGNYSGSFSGSIQISEIQSHLIPDTTEVYDLGSATHRFRDLYLSANSIDFPFGSLGGGDDGFGFSDPFGNPAPIQTKEVKVVDEADGSFAKLAVVNGELTTTAFDPFGNESAFDMKSQLSGSFTGSFLGEMLATNGIVSGSSQITIGSVTGFSAYSESVDDRILIEKGRVDAILASSDADKDSFAEIVTLINSVDTTNDNAFASFYTSSTDRLDNIEGFTSSIDTTIKTKMDADSVVSGSSQLVSLLPSGVVSSSAQVNADSITNFDSNVKTKLDSDGVISSSIQVDVLQTTNFTEFSSSVADTFGGLSTDYNDLQNIPSGIISSSEQLAADFLDTLGDNVVSSSAQIDLTQTTNYASGIKLKLDAENVFSSSAQVTITESQISDLVHYTDSDVKAKLDVEGVISGSSQVTIGDTAGFNTFSSSVADTFGGLSSDFDDLLNNPFTQSASQITTTKSIVPSNDSIDLGTSASPFRDLYLSSASLYIDGQQVISTADGDLNITTDANQSLRIVEEGVDTITVQSENGDITLVTTGTGNIELNAPVQIQAGKQILSSDGNAIQFGEDINVDGDITVTGTVDGVDVASLKNSVDAILDSSEADKDSFAEIVTLINSVDTTNDAAFAGFVTSSNAAQAVQDGRLDSLETESGSISSDLSNHVNDTTNPHSVTATQVGLGNVTNESKATMFTSPTFTGTVSGVSKAMVGLGNVDNTSDSNKPISTATQTALDGKLNINGDNVLSSSAQVLSELFGEDVQMGDITGSNLYLSGNAVIAGNVTIGDAANDTISFAADVSSDILPSATNTYDLGSSTDKFAEVHATNLYGTTNGVVNATNGVVSGSEQVTLGDVTGFNTFSSSVSDTFDGLSSNYVDLVGIPSGIVSGSSQIDVTATTNYSTVSSHIASTSNPHSVTATQVGLGNVTNESKATMFSSPTLTGTTTVGSISFGDASIATSSGTLGLTANSGISLLTSGGGDGVVISANGNTTIYGALALQDIATAGSATAALVVGGSNVVSQRTLGSNAFTSDTYALDSALTTEKNRIDAILDSADADKDSFAEIVALINSVDTSNDSAFASHATNTSNPHSVTKAQVGLGNVENIALSTYDGNGGALDNQYITNGAGYTTYTSNQATNTTSNVTFASVSATGDVIAYASSDRRLKDNIVNIENPIEKVQKLNGVTWDWNDNADELQKSISNVGVIAQEVEEVLPQLVKDRENGYKGVDYAKLTGLLIEAVKEQQKQIDELKSRLG